MRELGKGIIQRTGKQVELYELSLDWNILQTKTSLSFWTKIIVTPVKEIVPLISNPFPVSEDSEIFCSASTGLQQITTASTAVY
jgi:hypothetical protein